MSLRQIPLQKRLASAAFLAAALLICHGATLRAQRLTPSSVSVAAGALHTDAAGFGASFTGCYVLSNRLLALSLSPIDLGIGLGGAEGYHEDPGTVAGGGKICRDTNG